MHHFYRFPAGVPCFLHPHRGAPSLPRLYRFQLYCNLFGVGRHEAGVSAPLPEYDPLAPPEIRTAGRHCLEAVTRFVDQCEPWELEEIAAVHDFARGTYDQVFRDIYWHLHPENPRFEENSEGAINLSHWSHENLRHGTASRGLHLLHAVTFNRPQRTADLAEFMRSQLHKPVGPTLHADVFSRGAQAERRTGRASRRDAKQARRERLLFRGDGDVSLPLGAPAAAQYAESSLDLPTATVDNTPAEDMTLAAIVEAARRCKRGEQEASKGEPMVVGSEEDPTTDMAAEHELDAPVYPPSAWTATWEGVYSNSYGEYTKDWVRRWGCVMWDEQRLRSSGAWERLTSQPSRLPVFA